MLINAFAFSFKFHTVKDSIPHEFLGEIKVLGIRY